MIEEITFYYPKGNKETYEVVGSLFSEMRHRFDELEDEALRGWVPGGGEVDG